MRMSLDKSEERAAVEEKARARPARGWRRRENMIAEFRMACHAV
jgi:hypothetical protein